MYIPSHKIKNRVIYGDGSLPPRWSLVSPKGWLGSGVRDKNNREIFEGDILSIDFDAAEKICGTESLAKELRSQQLFAGADLIVEFNLGRFGLVWRTDTGAVDTNKDVYLLTDIKSCVEVIGHVAEPAS